MPPGTRLRITWPSVLSDLLHQIPLPNPTADLRGTAIRLTHDGLCTWTVQACGVTVSASMLLRPVWTRPAWDRVGMTRAVRATAQMAEYLDRVSASTPLER